MSDIVDGLQVQATIPARKQDARDNQRMVRELEASGQTEYRSYSIVKDNNKPVAFVVFANGSKTWFTYLVDALAYIDTLIEEDY